MAYFNINTWVIKVKTTVAIINIPQAFFVLSK